MWWNIPPIVPTGNNPDDAARLRWFNKWMVDTLQTGLDTLYGAFPPNVYIYDYFELVDSANFLPLSLSDSPTDSHPNEACTELVAPDFVQKAFNAAINYEVGIPTGIRESILKPNSYSLNQNYPNPFNPTTEINFSLAKSGNISLIIYDISGSVVDTLVDGYMNEGKHSVIFNAEGLNSGVYFYRLKTDNFTSTRKMILIK
ncbi:MAG: T9SS type A sorting domain-containing protein [bacterium]|nr:T9SS type A sorting domain-containing protein [bacterium]